MRMYLPPKQMKARIAIGRFTVWMIIVISFFVTTFYWYKLSGIEFDHSAMGVFYQAMLYSVIGIGMSAEIVKKVTLSTFRNRKLWFFATVVSVITILGSTLILQQTRDNHLQKSSDSYQDSRKSAQEAKTEASKYAYMKGVTEADLKAELQANIDRAGSPNARKKSGATYQEFVSKRDDINKRMADLRAYQSATKTAETETQNMQKGGSGSPVSNPLFLNIASITNFTVAFITITFYLSVTILLEVSAFWIGGEVEDMENHLMLSESELLDIQNKDMFGVSFREIQRQKFKAVLDAQEDQRKADMEIMRMRQQRTDENGKQLKAIEVLEKTRGIRTQQQENHDKAIGRNQPAGELTLAGQTLEEIQAKHQKAKQTKGKKVMCPSCDTEYIKTNTGQIFCCKPHNREYQKYRKRLEREAVV